MVAGANANATKIDRIRGLSAAVELVERHRERPRARPGDRSPQVGVIRRGSEKLDACEGAGTIGLELLEGSIALTQFCSRSAEAPWPLE